MSAADEILRIDNLVVDYGAGRRAFRAVDDVSLRIARGETLGLVGESGSGKTTIGRAVLGLVPIASGAIRFEGDDLASRSRRARRGLGNRLQVVFQDPYGSLDPMKTIGYTLAEPVLLHERGSRRDALVRVHTMLDRVGLPHGAASRYPAQFSGGQRQRIAIARALMLTPSLVVCDEPVSALDLSIQAEVVNLMSDLQRDLGVSFLFISHDLTVVRHLSHRIAVLQNGRIVEEGPADELYAAPRHPYTRALLDAAPVPDPDEQRERRRGRHKRAVALIDSTDLAPAP